MSYIDEMTLEQQDNSETDTENSFLDVVEMLDTVNNESSVEAVDIDTVESVMDAVDPSELSYEGHLDEQDGEEQNEVEKTELIRDLLDQNVSKQQMPSSKRVEWENAEQSGNCDCTIQDDEIIKIHYKSSGETVEFTGEDFKAYMLDNYGTDKVNYSHREPDFEPFEKVLKKEDVEDFLFKKYGENREVMGDVEGHLVADKIGTKRIGKEGTFAFAEEEISSQLGISSNDLNEYIEENDLTWHECGDRKTIRLVPTEINQAFKHTGGIGLQKDLEALVERISDQHGELANFTLCRDAIEGEVNGLQDAIDDTYQRNIDKKKEMFCK